MLILVGTTINLSMDGKLFEKTHEAVEKTQEGIDKEKETEDKILGKRKCSHEWSEWEIQGYEAYGEARFKRSRKCSKCEQEQSYMYGAYVDGYDPSIGENGETIETTYTSKGSTTGGTKEQDKTTDGSTGNGYADQTFEVTSIPLWKVIGQTDDGRLIIMSDSSIKTADGSNYFLRNQAGYLNAITELNKICSIYGQGKYADKTLYTVGDGTKRASGARSIKLEDTFKCTTVENTYEIKIDEEDGKEYVYKNGQKDTNAMRKVIYFDEKTQEWIRLKVEDGPIVFKDRDFEKIDGKNGHAVINGTWIGASNSVLMSNKDGEWQQCWFTAKNTSVYYYWTYGCCIWSAQRAGPVPVAPTDRIIWRKWSSTSSNFKKQHKL